MAAGSCDRVAAVSGSDSNPGTVASPFRTAQRLVDSLGTGQTGCLRNGLFDSDDQVAFRRAGITLTSYPGERATLKGRVYIVKGADHVTVSDMDIDGRNSLDTGPAVDAAYTTFDNLDVTNHHTGNCFILGNSDPYYGRASHTVIQNSRIHDCGKLPATNQDHGIYISAADDTIIRNNLIYGNADRGVQIYPDSQGAHVYGNVIDGNGEALVISGDGQDASSNNLIENNVISNSRERWNVESFWNGGKVGTGNVLRDNCLVASNSDDYYNQDGGVMPASEGGKGFASFANRSVDSSFVATATASLSSQDGNACGDGAFVILKPIGHKVDPGDKVTFSGRATPPTAKSVTIQIRRHGHWRAYAHAKLKGNGRFKVAKRVHGRVLKRHTQMRARVLGIGSSKPVALRARA